MTITDQGLDPSLPSKPRLSIHGIRKLLFVVLTLSVFSFTIGVSLLVQRIFQNFGPAVQHDLDWKTVRGAQELAKACDLGLAVGDEALVNQAFGEYRQVKDVLAIVAVGSDGNVVASHGSPPEAPASLFQGAPAAIRRTPGYQVAWAPAAVEGNAVGKIAIVISTQRFVESKEQLRRISYGTAIAGVLVFIFGILFVNFFTRAIIKRDSQLAAHAADLENKVAERTAELDRRNQGMRLVLDNVTQGFITVGMDGVMATEHSSIVDTWFGKVPEGKAFADYIRKWDPAAADWFTVGLEALIEDFLPRDLLLSQLPKRLVSGRQTWSISYRPITAKNSDTLERLLVVLSDITHELAREQIERDSHEMIRIFQRVTSDHRGAEQFFDEAGHLAGQIAEGKAAPEVEARLIHTLKGNCALFGIESMAQICHDIETAMLAERRGSVEDERKRITAHWDHITKLTNGIMGERRSTIELEEVDLQELVKAIHSRAPHEELVAITESWRHEPVGLRFARLAEKAVYLSRRLGRPAVTIHTETSGIRLDSTRWAPFWGALVHAVNNAVDHGIEEPDVRKAKGKSPSGSLWLAARRENSDLIISIHDDGKGIDWARLTEKGAERGMPTATRADLIEVMCAQGISTAATTSQTSGRGVGLAALREVTLSLNGRMDVESEPGQGTTFVFRFAGHG